VIYPELLESSFDKLPRALRHFHSSPSGGRAVGTVTVSRHNRVIAWLVGFPPSGSQLPLKLEVTVREDREVWVRQFGDFVMKSVQRRAGELLLETFGPLRVFIRILADESGMRFISERARWWIVPVPVRVEARAFGNESSWSFEVTVAGVGSYRGKVTLDG